MMWDKVTLKTKKNAQNQTKIWRKDDQVLIINPGYLKASDFGLTADLRVYLMLTHVALDTCARLAQLKIDLKAKFYTHAIFLPKLCSLRLWASRAGLCGVYIPKANRVWTDPHASIEDLGVSYTLESRGEEKYLTYMFL